jgi:hypothetical protein
MATRKINTKRLVHDIRFGMIELDTRMKHRLSSTALRTLFGGLYREMDITPSRLYETSRPHGKGIGYIPAKKTPKTETMVEVRGNTVAVPLNGLDVTGLCGIVGKSLSLQIRSGFLTRSDLKVIRITNNKAPVFMQR